MGIARQLKYCQPSRIQITGNRRPMFEHDVAAAKKYAERLKTLSDEIADQVFIVMRAYFSRAALLAGKD